jgi:chorismate mutase/prephenate dehydratase
MAKTLEQLREEIDRLDDQILPLLNQRAELAVEIGKIKKANGAPLHVPSRERDVISRLTAANKGPMTSDALVKIYKEIMASALALEHQDDAG